MFERCAPGGENDDDGDVVGCGHGFVDNVVSDKGGWKGKDGDFNGCVVLL